MHTSIITMAVGSLILSLSILLSILVTFFDLQILRKFKAPNNDLFIKVWTILTVAGVVIFFSGYAFALPSPPFLGMVTKP
ncbi:hypothetical protein HK19_15435 [Acetobacter persici]|nr:hypothetical protein HK19_15435 [Acetobacter persici]